MTHIFDPDDPYINSDAVFGVKESLLAAFQADKRSGTRKGIRFPRSFLGRRARFRAGSQIADSSQVRFSRMWAAPTCTLSAIRSFARYLLFDSRQQANSQTSGKKEHRCNRASCYVFDPRHDILGNEAAEISNGIDGCRDRLQHRRPRNREGRLQKTGWPERYGGSDGQKRELQRVVGDQCGKQQRYRTDKSRMTI